MKELTQVVETGQSTITDLENTITSHTLTIDSLKRKNQSQQEANQSLQDMLQSKNGELESIQASLVRNQKQLEEYIILVSQQKEQISLLSSQIPSSSEETTVSDTPQHTHSNDSLFDGMIGCWV